MIDTRTDTQTHTQTQAMKIKNAFGNYHFKTSISQSSRSNTGNAMIRHVAREQWSKDMPKNLTKYMMYIYIYIYIYSSCNVFVHNCTSPPLFSSFIHVMVDPVFLALGCVPFILIKALPKVSAAHTCMYSPHGYPYKAENGHTHIHNPSQEDKHRIHCLMGIFSDTSGNQTMDIDREGLEQEFRNNLVSVKHIMW